MAKKTKKQPKKITKAKVKASKKPKKQGVKKTAAKAAKAGKKGGAKKIARKTSPKKASSAKTASAKADVVFNTGDLAPGFTLPSDEGGLVSLSDLRGKKVILYFYPKDDTPGCTQESCDFRDSFTRLKGLNAVVLGVSKDSVESHVKFKKKYGFPFPLLSDDEGVVCEAYGVWKEKNNYGKKYMGIERSTFLIDENGKIAKAYPKVRVEGHVDEIIRDIGGA